MGISTSAPGSNPLSNITAAFAAAAAHAPVV
jgi:hypothetical protein